MDKTTAIQMLEKKIIASKERQEDAEEHLLIYQNAYKSLQAPKTYDEHVTIQTIKNLLKTYSEKIEREKKEQEFYLFLLPLIL